MSEKPRRWFSYSVAALLALMLLIVGGINVQWLYERNTFVDRVDSYGDWYSPGKGPNIPTLARLYGHDGASQIVVRRKADLARTKWLFPEANVQAAEGLHGVPSGVRFPKVYMEWLKSRAKRP